MKNIKIKKAQKLSTDGINVISFAKNEIVQNPSDKLLKMLGKNYTEVKQKAEAIELEDTKNDLDNAGVVLDKSNPDPAS